MKAIAPGKLILSGEHAVVYGRPALAMAVNRNAQTLVMGEGDTAGPGQVSFALPNVGVERESFTLRALRDFHARLSRNYRDFVAGRLPISEVVRKPLDLFEYAFVTILDGLHLKVREGIGVTTLSNIPIGCGMGSSAATILSLLRGVGHYYRVEFRPEWYYRYSLEVENMQHGHASGLDTYVSMNGGCVRFQQGKAEPLPLPRMPLFLVNTGTPASSTGEAVAEVARATGPKAPVWDDFEAVTNHMQDALAHDDLRAFQRAMSDNERLLEDIGVVPARVAEFIRGVEAAGGAAKICGGGAVRGDASGVVLVAARQAPAELCQSFGYEMMTVRPDPLGVRVV
ncbi:MAG: mevalonate kinase [Kiritimatiellae bacterium]|nr:mevalonate kinase [Kiritimatiellia bacterium]